MYTSEDVEMLVQGKHTTLSIWAWSEEYLYVQMEDYYYTSLDIRLSKEQAELLRDKLDVFLGMGLTKGFETK